MSVKKIIVGGVEHQIDYNALENLPPAPKKIEIINFIPDSSKDDGRPAKSAAYADGKIDSVEIYRYACPEQIDIDSTVDENGDPVLEPETHLSYYKDGRSIFARDGDFGYPELDGTGQFNFKPVWNKNASGYVLVPVVRDFAGKLHDGNKTVNRYDPITGEIAAVDNPDYNPCYNNFKTPWITGIDGVYRFTKVCKDIKIDLQAVAESSLATNTITYNIVAPEAYEGELPIVKVFRSGDQAEKYFKYGPGATNAPAHPVLSNAIISGTTLEFDEPVVGDGVKTWSASGITYDDATGYPLQDGGKVVILIDDTPVTSASEYTVSSAATPKANYKNFSAGDYGPTKQLTKVTGNVTVTITIAPPVSVAYNKNGNELTYEEEKNGVVTTKVAYGFEATECPESCAQGSGLQFTLVHGEGDTAHGGLGWYETGPKGAKYMVKQDGSALTNADVYPYIASITVGGTQVELATAIESVGYTSKKAKIVLAGSIITGDVVITLAPRPGERTWPEQE